MSNLELDVSGQMQEMPSMELGMAPAINLKLEDSSKTKQISNLELDSTKQIQ